MGEDLSESKEGRWKDVPEGSCVECWINKIVSLGAEVEWIQNDRYVIWSPSRREFHGFQVSAEMAGECVGLEARIRNMSDIKEHL